MVEQDGEVWGKSLKLANPIGESRQRADNEEGSLEAMLKQMGQEADSLDGFPETHFISENLSG